MSSLRAALAEARGGLRRRRRGSALTALGIALATAMLSAAVVVADGLGGGFERSARAADLPDIIVRFTPEGAQQVDQHIAALPDIASYSTRLEFTGTGIGLPGGPRRGDAVAEVMTGQGRPGYAVVQGHNLARTGNQILVELAFAQAWHLHIGSTMYVGGLGPETVVGFTEAPDNVGYPLAKPRIYLSRPALEARFGQRVPDPNVNLAEIWLRNPRYLNEVLVQARSSSFGLRNIQFATRAGVRILVDQAAGIVIDLLVALSVIALVTASVMLAASARAEVQRRLGAIGVRRAVGAPRGHIALTQGVEAAIIALPAAAVGLTAGLLSTFGPSDRLLTMLNEPSPGTALVLPLAATLLASVAIPVLGAAWPAWQAAGRSPVGLLRGGELETRRGGHRRRGGQSGGLTMLGARLALARRVRLAATVLTLSLSAGFVLLMLALASALSALETDPQELGKRYQLTATLPAGAVPEVRAIPGVAAAAPRYETQAADSYELGETIDVIAYPGDPTRFEDPPLAAGHRPRGPLQAEVGVGLADALGLSPGSTLALALSSGSELRLRVAGTVSSLDHDGRVAYIPAAALLRVDPGAPHQIVVELTPGADQNGVSAALTRLGAQPAAASGATARGAPLVDALRTILIAIAVVDGLVCLYALIQACTLTVQERRRTVAVLRAAGAGPSAVRRLLTGATLTLVVPAAIVGILLERFVFGPELSHLAANYATLVLDPTAAEIVVTLAGLALASAVAVVWVARQAARESVVTGLAAR